MPIYEFKCGDCGEQFEDLVSADVDTIPCPYCNSGTVYRLISLVSSKGMSSGGCQSCTPTPTKCKGCPSAR
jgi:putative FmdB family regulatory protein